MTNQESPLWMRLGMHYDLSLPWTSFNMAMALNIRLLINPQVHRMTKEGKTAPGEQLDHLPAAVIPAGCTYRHASNVHSHCK